MLLALAAAVVEALVDWALQIMLSKQEVVALVAVEVTLLLE
jgi:hypothetical protein